MFQVGDIVIGNENNTCFVTCSGRRGIVVDRRKSCDNSDGYEIRLKCYPDDAFEDIDRGFDSNWPDNQLYWVPSEMFDLYKPHETVSLSEYIMG